MLGTPKQHLQRLFSTPEDRIRLVVTSANLENFLIRLSESSAASFYLLKIEAIRIGDSPPAPLLTLITGPSEESREVGETKKDLAERYEIRQEFWTALLARARDRTKLHSNISPSRESWISKGAGKSGLGYNYVIHQHAGRVELYIDQGQGSEEDNKRIFDVLYEHRMQIEAAFGEVLEWQRLDTKRACRICKVIDVGEYRDHDRWPEIADAMIDVMVRLEQALRPHISRLGR